MTGVQTCALPICTVAAIFLFILFGGGVLFGAYTLFFTEKTPPLKLNIDTLVLSEKSIDIDVTNLTRKNTVAKLTQAKDSVDAQADTIVNFREIGRASCRKRV